MTGKDKVRTFSFGKVDYCNCGRKINEITLQVTLYADRNGYPEFTVCADVWNIRHTDIVAGGQMVDKLYEKYPQCWGILYRTIHDLWLKYHCKDVSNIPKEDRELIDLLVSDKSREEIVAELKEMKKSAWHDFIPSLLY